MAIVENHTQHQVDLNSPAGSASVPRGNGQQGEQKVAGSAEVADAIIEAIRSDPASAKWLKAQLDLGVDGGLVIKTAGNAKAHAAHDDKDHGKGHGK